MIVARMPPQFQRLRGGAAGGFKHFRIQLLCQEFIAQSLVDQYAGREGRRRRAISRLAS
jgi:hypothetical protein